MIAPSAAHVFVADLDEPAHQLDSVDARHLQRVLRLRPDEVVTAGDGAGRWQLCRLVSEGGLDVRLEPTGPIVSEPAPEPAVTVGFAPVKGDRPEWAVQKLTELGVDRIVPLVASRSVVRWQEPDRGDRGDPGDPGEPGGRGDRARHQVERWRRIAREAAMQSRRAWLPVVAELRPFAEALRVTGLDRLALAHPGGMAPSLERPAILVGPEGGWTSEELAAAPVHVSLGSTVLRTETAAVVAGALLGALRGGLVVPPYQT
jgi:16S rRNA (uracil1498-N3)-methyltransferase